MTDAWGDMIKERRSALGMTQARLAELVGRSSTAVRAWERNQSLPTDPEVIDALEAVLGIDLGVDDSAGERTDDGWADAGDTVTDAADDADEADEDAGDGESVEGLLEAEPGDAEPADEPVNGELSEVEPAAETTADPNASADSGDPSSDPVEDPTQVIVRDAPRVIATATAAHSEVLAGPRAPQPTPDAPGTPVASGPPSPAPERTSTAREPEATAVLGETFATGSTATGGSRPVSDDPFGPAPATPSGVGRFDASYLDDPATLRLYRMRALFTAAAALGLLIVLRWAMGGATGAWRQIWETFRSGF